MGSLDISEMVVGSWSAFTVMFSTCFEPLKEKFSRFNLFRRFLYLIWVSVVVGVSHLYCSRTYLGFEVVGAVVGIEDLESGMKEFLL